MRAVELDGAEPGDEFAESMETCVQCRGCEAACPSLVPFGHLMEETRASAPMRSRVRRAPVRRLAEWGAFTVVLPRHRVLLAVTWLIAVAQRVRLLPRRLGIPRLSFGQLRAPLDADDATSADAFLFPGCVMDAWQRAVHRDAITVMRATGARVALPGGGADCCGALHAHAGRIAEARRLARHLVASLPGTAPVVVDSAGCGAAMQDYGRLLGTAEAAAFAARVQDFSTWVAGRTPPPLRDTGETVVIQDPCHLRHVQRAHDAVRRVLAPAYRLRETADDGLCCGAGGAFAVQHPHLANEVRDRKVAALRAAAGDANRSAIVVSANPGCAMHLAAAGLAVRHPAELLARALEPPRA